MLTEEDSLKTVKGLESVSIGQKAIDTLIDILIGVALALASFTTLL